MGLIATGVRLLGSLFGGGAAVAAPVARTALQRVGGAILSPLGQGVLGGALGAGAVGLFGGDGAAAPGMGGGQLAQLVAGGAQPTALSGGRFLVTAPNGDVQVFNRNGQPIRPQLIIPAGQRLPGGSIVVSTRNGGSLIGITRRRARRRFGTEIRRVRRTVQAAQALVKLCKPTGRKS